MDLAVGTVIMMLSGVPMKLELPFKDAAACNAALEQVKLAVSKAAPTVSTGCTTPCRGTMTWSFWMSCCPKWTASRFAGK